MEMTAALNLLDIGLLPVKRVKEVLHIMEGKGEFYELVSRRLGELYPQAELRELAVPDLSHEDLVAACESSREGLCFISVEGDTRREGLRGIPFRNLLHLYEAANSFHDRNAVSVVDASYSVLAVGQVWQLSTWFVAPGAAINCFAHHSLKELRELYSRAAGLRSGTIVEIGRYLGGSTSALASGVRDNGYCRPRFVSIDIADHEFGRRTIRENGLDAYVEILAGASMDYVHAEHPGFDDIELLFIDGNHEFDSAKKDIAGWGECLRPGGTMIVHDYYTYLWQGVNLAVREFLGESDAWEPVDAAETMLFLRKKPG